MYILLVMIKAWMICITSASVEDPYEYPGQGHGGAGYQYQPTITPPDT